MPRPKRDELTERQRAILRMLAEGKTNGEIAETLGISLDGAKYHVREIITKLGVDSREEAAEWWRRAERRAVGFHRVLAALPLKAVIGRAGLVLGAAAAVGLAIGVVAFGRQDNSGDLGKVAYIQNGDLWVKSLPSGTPERLTSDGAVLRPQWSLSGKWLLFERTPPAPQDRFGGWVIRADGSGERKVVSQGGVSWAPHEDQLALVIPGDPLALGASVLLVEQADGSGRRQLLPALPGGGTLDRRMNPQWSSDGRWIVFEEQHQDHSGSGWLQLRRRPRGSGRWQRNG